MEFTGSIFKDGGDQVMAETVVFTVRDETISGDLDSATALPSRPKVAVTILGECNYITRTQALGTPVAAEASIFENRQASTVADPYPAVRRFV
jgi:hypothetical protein